MTFKPVSLQKIDLIDPNTGLAPATIPVTGQLTPPQIATAYNIPASLGTGVKIGIISLGGGFLQSDLNESFTDLKNAGLIDSGIATPTIHQVLVDGASGSFVGDLNSSGENTVDIFCAATMAPGATITIYIGQNTLSGFQNVFAQAISDGNHILTCSWGGPESGSDDLGTQFTAAANAHIAICTASGDFGSVPVDGDNVLQVQYPTASAQVISVGGTHLYLNTNNTRSSEVPETATNDPEFPAGWGGGGGVSAYTNLPNWQSGLHYTPITSGTTGSPTPLTKRGVPDISGPMNAYALYFNGSIAGYGGTSLASPTVAGILARFQALTGIQRSSAEYNTIFYANTGSFYDITTGNNADAITSGYASTVGWDAVTGLGAPIGSSLLSVLNNIIATYSVTPSTTQLIEGQNVSFTINTTSVNNGTSLYWTNDGTATLAEVTVNSGTFTINGGTAIVTVSTINGGTAEGQTIVFDVRTQSTAGTIVASAPTVNIYQPIVTSIDVAVKSFTTGVPVNPFTPVSASGGYSTLTWSISPGLPSGLSLNPTNGQVSGTPAGYSPTTLYTITVTDAIGQISSRSVSFNVVSNILEIAVARQENPVAVYNNPIDPYQPVVVTHPGNGTITWSITPALPAGLSFDTVTGYMSGTPQVKESLSTYTITAIDQSAQSKSANFELKIVRSSDLILSDYYNFLYDKLFSLMGTTATGYGAVLLGSPVVSVGQPVRALEWNQMHDDMIRSIVHQNGTSTNNLFMATTGSVAQASVPDRTWTELQFLELNPDKIADNQKAIMRVNTFEVSPDQWESDWTYTTSTNTSSWHTVTSNGYITSVSYTWFHPIQLNYFFNLGGVITPEIQTTSTVASVWQAWAPLITVANTIKFGKPEFIEATANAGLYQRIITGGGKKGKTSKALMLTFQITGAVLSASIEFLADYHKKKKNKKKKKNSNNYLVRLKISTDFVTTYAIDYQGGIRAPIPQSQLMGNHLSAPNAPIPIFSFATETTSTTRTITLRNNSTQTCHISNISLTGYTHGHVSTTTMTILPHTSDTFNMYYTGSIAGYYRGFVRILSNLNNLTLFTELNVGGVTPTHLTLSTTTNDLIVQDFIVDHAGGEYRDFIVAPFTSPGYSYKLIPSGLYQAGGFRMTFAPHGLPNGLHTENAQVTVLPSDTSLDNVTISVPINITTNINNVELGHWISAKGAHGSQIGFSYGYIGGHKFLTIGVGANLPRAPNLAPNIDQLHTESTFNSWKEVYRIPLDTHNFIIYHFGVYHVGNYQIYGAEKSLGSYFGVGNAEGSICTIKGDGKGNLNIVLNTLREYSDNTSIMIPIQSLSNAFYYYDETANRTSQLETTSELVDGILTHYFAGFDHTGKVVTTLVNPNLLSN